MLLLWSSIKGNSWNSWKWTQWSSETHQMFERTNKTRETKLTSLSQHWHEFSIDLKACRLQLETTLRSSPTLEQVDCRRCLAQHGSVKLGIKLQISGQKCRWINSNCGDQTRYFRPKHVLSFPNLNREVYVPKLNQSMITVMSPHNI